MQEFQPRVQIQTIGRVHHTPLGDSEAGHLCTHGCCVSNEPPPTFTQCERLYDKLKRCYRQVSLQQHPDDQEFTLHILFCRRPLSIHCCVLRRLQRDTR